MTTTPFRGFALTLAAVLLSIAPLHAQEGRALELTVGDVGIAIGDAPRVIGLRLNFRDRHLEQVIGANLTVWTPYEYTGRVHGLALGLPATGARRIDGVGVGIFGVSASESSRGVIVGGLGVGAGSDVRGVAAGGLGVGAGSDVRGVVAGGLGVGAGSDIRGVAAGGLGVGAGSDVRGVAAGGLGVGVGSELRGVAAGGLGVGVGGNATGLLAGGVGVGVGGDLRGLTVAGGAIGVGGDVNGVQAAGLGIGTGGTLRWVSLAGLGIGATGIDGLAAAPLVGARDVRGIVMAPAYFRVVDDGAVRGLNVSAFNDVRGTQQGLAIGIFNYARHLDGLQVGILNYARNKPPGTRLLPILNYARDRR